MHCNNGRKSNSDEVAGLATTCHCEYETKYDGTPASDACGVMSDPWPSKFENGIRTFRQEKGQKRLVATMSHRVYHVGNLGCYKCANHDMQVRDVPPGTRGSATSAKPASTAPTNQDRNLSVGNSLYIVYISVLVKVPGMSVLQPQAHEKSSRR